jgi:hypothetical protein
LLQLQATPSSPYTLSIYLSVIPYNIPKNFFNFNCQPQEEAGSAGGQPVSNKADTYTVSISSQSRAAHFYLLPVSYMASKTHICLLF